MIVDMEKSCFTHNVLKKFITLNPRVRTLFLLFFLSIQAVFSQTREVDSLVHLLNTKTLDDSTRIYIMHHISYKLSETDLKKSYEYYERVSSLSDSLNFTYGKALGNINLVILLSACGNFDSGTKAWIKAAELAKSCNALRVESVALNNIGENFASLKDYNRCRQYALQAIDINKSIKAWRGVAINYGLLNDCDFEQGQYKEAKINLDTGMYYASMINDSSVLVVFFLGYGRLQAINNHNDSAKYFFDKALAYASQTGELRDEFDVYIDQAQFLKHISNREKTTILLKAIGLAEKIDFAEGRSAAAEQLSSLYDAENKKDSSLFYYRMYRSVTDSLFSETNRRNTILNESEWTVKKKELENLKLIEVTSTQKKEIAIKNIELILICIGFILSLLAAFIYNKSLQSKKIKNESLYKQKIAETEMHALQAQMNPHFFFNSLNSIENFIMQNEKKLASDYLNKFARFIRSVLDSSYSELIEINKDIQSLQLYIDLELMRFNNKFTFSTQIDPALQDGEYHVPALLVQPFLENAINHGIGPSDRNDLKIS